MKIIHIEKLKDCDVIVATGRLKYIRALAREMQARLYHAPRSDDYFVDYPNVAEELQDVISLENKPVIIETQSKEFLDVLLESAIDFTLATVRHYDEDDDDVHRLRILPKDEALSLRENFDIELRV